MSNYGTDEYLNEFTNDQDYVNRTGEYSTGNGASPGTRDAQGMYAQDYGYRNWADKASSDKFWAQNREDDIRRETFNNNLALANARSSGSSGSSRGGSGGSGGSTGWGASSAVPSGSYGSGIFGKYDAATASPEGNGFNSADSVRVTNMLRDFGYGLDNYTPLASPVFTAPEFNKSGYKSFANQMAQGPNRELSRIIQKVVLSNYGKPAPLARMNTSAALEKGAEGFANIGAKATEYGQRQYELEYNRAFNAAMANFNAQNQNIMAQNSAAANKQQTMASTIMNSYMRG